MGEAAVVAARTGKRPRGCVLDHRDLYQIRGRGRDRTKTVGCRIKLEREIRGLCWRRHCTVYGATPGDNRRDIWGDLFKE